MVQYLKMGFIEQDAIPIRKKSSTEIIPSKWRNSISRLIKQLQVYIPEISANKTITSIFTKK